MTWTSTKETGRGTLSYRLEIERLPQQFVTHSSMTNQVRLPGLTVDGKLKCLSNPISGEIDVSGLSVSIVDISGGATAIFGKTPENVTYLTAQCTHGVTSSMSVQSTAGWPSAGSLWIDSEAITYTNITATSFTGLTRGEYGSLDQTHYTAAVGVARFPEVTSTIPSLAGCRARLYVYGDNDDPQGDGTQIWLGIINRHPTMQGATWKLTLDPITSVLTRTLAGDLAEPATPRGIKYDHQNSFEFDVGSPSISTVVGFAFPTSTSDTAFFENNEAFCEHANAKMAAAITAAGWDTTYDLQVRFVADGDASWHIDMISDSTPFRPAIRGPVTDIDPEFGQFPVDDDGAEVDYSSWAAGTVYHFYPIGGVPGAGSVPRGFVGSRLNPATYVDGPMEEAFPIRKVYLSGSAVASLADSVAVKWQECGAYPASDDTPEIEAADSAENSITLVQGYRPEAAPGTFISDPAHGFTSASLPLMRFGRTYTESGSVWTALFRIITLGPEFINLGGVPDIRSGDFDAASWGQLDLDSQPRIIRARRFVSYSDTSLADLIKQELLLAGYMLGINATGRISIAPIRTAVATEVASHELTSPIVSSSVPTWEPTAYGTINAVRVARGYSPIEDEYLASPVIVRNVLAFSRNPRTRLANIEPKSTPYTGPETAEEVLETAMRLFSVFSSPYATITCHAPLTAYDTATVGSIVAITSPHLPNMDDGTRGVTALRGMVTGREIDLRGGTIMLRLYAATDRVGGYAPAGRITAETNTSGNTWELTLSADYFPSGTTAEDWFNAGDTVVTRRWNSTSATFYTGDVVSASGNVVTVTFGGSAAGLSSDTWYLSYWAADAIAVEAQAAYCYLASSDGRLDFSGLGVERPARVFG